MKINREYVGIKEAQSRAIVISAKLCFENLRCTDYKEGYLVTKSNLAQEKKDSPLCKLATFSNIMVDKCNINESDNTSSIYVNAIVNGKDNLQSLYEWIEKYAGKDKVDAIAPGLLEALEQDSEAEKIDENNSVATRFAKYRKLYEDNSADEEKSDSEEDDDSKKDDGEEKSDDEGKENSDDEGKENSDDESEEQDELTAIVLEVKKGDEDKLKDELIEAGVDEDDIEIITEDEGSEDEDKEDESEEKNEGEEEDGDDEDKDETVKVKIAVDSFDALREYLEGKGFNLEEELGGEIVSDDSEDSEGDDEDGKKDQEELDAEFDGFDDLFK